MFIYEPPVPSRRIKSMPGRPQNRRVDDTIEHISQGWIPVNPAILKEVQEKLRDGEYKNNPDRLAEDIKADPGLFVHAARNLKPIVEDVQTGLDPLAELTKLEDEQLSKLFAVSEKQLSSHRFKDMRQTQALRMQHTVISSCAAEAIAQRVEVSPSLAFSAAMFRQLGHNLIAWNYPDIYARALSHQKKKGAEVALELKKFLGVSPLQIGSKFAAEWSMSFELRQALNPAGDSDLKSGRKQSELEDRALTLENICQASDLFAQANDPAHYPAAREKWKETEARFANVVTPDLLLEIEKPVHRVLALCDEFLPKVLTPAYFHVRQSDEGMPERGKALYAANSYAKRSPDKVKEAVVKVYMRIRNSDVSIEALRAVVDHVIPTTGFVRGCLYLVDKATLNLRPMLRIGDVPLTDYPVVKQYESHIVAQSLRSNAPYREVGAGIKASSVFRTCSSLGFGLRPGVLYLEAAEEDKAAGPADILSFQLIKQCLLDALGDKIQEES